MLTHEIKGIKKTLSGFKQHSVCHTPCSNKQTETGNTDRGRDAPPRPGLCKVPWQPERQCWCNWNGCGLVTMEIVCQCRQDAVAASSHKSRAYAIKECAPERGYNNVNDVTFLTDKYWWVCFTCNDWGGPAAAALSQTQTQTQTHQERSVVRACLCKRRCRETKLSAFSDKYHHIKVQK